MYKCACSAPGLNPAADQQPVVVLVIRTCFSLLGLAPLLLYRVYRDVPVCMLTSRAHPIAVRQVHHGPRFAHASAVLGPSPLLLYRIYRGVPVWPLGPWTEPVVQQQLLILDVPTRHQQKTQYVRAPCI